jgi:multidrug resistance protein MdtO
VVLTAAVAAIAGWVATGSERIAYAGLQIAFAFFISVFQGYAPDTDLDKIRDRVVGILIGIVVTAVIFHYIWPEREADQANRAS